MLWHSQCWLGKLALLLLDCFEAKLQRLNDLASDYNAYLVAAMATPVATLLATGSVVNEVELVAGSVTVVAGILVDRSSLALVTSLVRVVAAVLVNGSEVTITAVLVSLVESEVAIGASVLVDVAGVIATGESDVVTGTAAEASVAVATVAATETAAVATVAVATVAVASMAVGVAIAEFVDANTSSGVAAGTAATDSTVRVATGNVGTAAERSSVAVATELSGVTVVLAADATVRVATGTAATDGTVRVAAGNVGLWAVRSSVARAVGAVLSVSPGGGNGNEASESKLVHFLFVDYVKNLRNSERLLLK